MFICASCAGRSGSGQFPEGVFTSRYACAADLGSDSSLRPRPGGAGGYSWRMRRIDLLAAAGDQEEIVSRLGAGHPTTNVSGKTHSLRNHSH